MTERLAAVDEHLDAATEDLVALLGSELAPPPGQAQPPGEPAPLDRPPAPGPPGGPRRRGLTDALADLDADGEPTGAGTVTGSTHLEADSTEVYDDGRMLG